MTTLAFDVERDSVLMYDKTRRERQRNAVLALLLPAVLAHEQFSSLSWLRYVVCGNPNNLWTGKRSPKRTFWSSTAVISWISTKETCVVLVKV